MGSPIGERVTLNCRVEAYPAAITYWMRKRDNGKDEMLMNGPEFSIQEQKFEFRTEISLVIDNFDREDVGVYTCTATNSFGTKESKARLYGKFMFNLIPFHPEKCVSIFWISEMVQKTNTPISTTISSSSSNNGKK